ncbi:hypothetical protein TARUN_1760 [Trichoderma arundinaceum]|uniref:Uncharacterized protein n=1 Tax=Trichoderma arundinaceum TaxID=490622 RepID=A0A395NXF3_TRIAR|nr:hypothetical protein TARUN_1760 [Trichoderma arundinaceum]
MAPRSKPNTRARLQRASTKFSELDVTPNRPDNDEKEKMLLSQDTTTQVPYPWSEGESTNVTRRSTPVDPNDLLEEDTWDFGSEDESLAPFSSPNTGTQLPDTMPIVRASQTNERAPTPGPQVDFSETASTIRRSSPFSMSDAHKSLWDFQDSPSSSSPFADAIDKGNQGQREADNDIYDATPRKVGTPILPIAGSQSNDVETINARSYSVDTRSQVSAKGKRHRPRAKEPIKFDPLTQEIIIAPAAKIKKAPPKAPIVKETTASRKSKEPKPKRSRLAKGVQSVVVSSSDIVTESPLVSLQELPRAGQHEEMKPNPPTSANKVFDAKKASEQQRGCPPPATAEPDLIPTEHIQFKRRTLSRQFSISEKGSPVVSRDAPPMSKAELDPFVTFDSEERTTLQSSSFLRTAASDRRYDGQQEHHDGVFHDMHGKSSSRWLRRMSDKKPDQQHKSSMGRKLHDEIMKSFLGTAEMAQASEDSTPASLVDANNASRLNKQIRLMADQLIAHLDSKKAAASRVAEVYHKSGTDSVALLRQRCLQDRDNLAETFQKDESLFKTNLQVARDAIKMRSLARAKSAMGLDQVMEARRRVCNRARLELRAARNGLVGGNGALLG